MGIIEIGVGSVFTAAAKTKNCRWQGLLRKKSDWVLQRYDKFDSNKQPNIISYENN